MYVYVLRCFLYTSVKPTVIVHGHVVGQRVSRDTVSKNTVYFQTNYIVILVITHQCYTFNIRAKEWNDIQLEL